MEKLTRLCFLICIVIITACAEQGGEAAGDATGITDSEIVLGSWGPLTGPAALWGSVPKAMDAYFKMINEEGGIHGRTIRFVYRDDGYDPSRTVGVVREMVQRDQVFAFVGGIGTATGMAVKDFIVENNIPWINPMSGVSHWAYPQSNNIFSGFTLYFDEAEVQADYVINTLNAEKIAIIYQNDDLGKSALIAAKRALAKHGKDFAAEVSYEITDSDLTSHAARLQESGADVVLLWTAPRQAAIVLGTTAVSGYKPQWVASAILSDMALMYDITKGLWKDVIFNYYGKLPFEEDPTLAKYKEVLAKYQPDVRWGAFSASGFLYAEPLVEALKAAGPELTREKLIASMEALDYQGIGAKFTFGPNKRQGQRALFMAKCIGPEEAEVLTDYIEATANIEELAAELTAN